MTKEEIRNRQKELRNNLSLDDWTNLCTSIKERLLQTEAYKKCNLIFSYVSFRSEVDTKAIINQSFLDNKHVYVPRVNAKNMDFYEIHHLNGLTISKFGVPEPPEDDFNRYIENNQKYQKLMLLPGLAFDCSGNRVGYGAGYYDRYLSTHTESHFYKIALAFDFQVIEKIDADEYDIKADAILTPTKFIITGNNSLEL